METTELFSPSTVSFLNSTNGSVAFDLLFNETDSVFSDFNATTTPQPINRRPMSFPGKELMWNTKYFSRTYTFLSYIIGIPGNTFSVIILSRMRPMNSSIVWLLVMAVLDLESLLARCSISPFFQYGYLEYNHPICLFTMISVRVTEYGTYMVMTAMTAERLIAVWFPLKMGVWCSPKRAAIAAGVICGLILLGEMHHPITTGAYTTSCQTKPQYKKFWFEIYHEKIQAIALRLMPSVLVILMNILIIIGIHKNRAVQKTMTSTSDEQNKRKIKQQRNADRLLTAATIFFGISTLPDFFYRIVAPYVFKMTWPVVRDLNIAMNATAALRIGNHAGNFYLYIVAATKFRSEFIHLMTCGRYGEHNGKKGSRIRKK